MPHARIPSFDDLAWWITVMRRRREVGYRTSYLGFMEDPPADPPLALNFKYILTSPPHI